MHSSSKFVQFNTIVDMLFFLVASIKEFTASQHEKLGDDKNRKPQDKISNVKVRQFKV